jgi:hypothetical protein
MQMSDRIERDDLIRFVAEPTGQELVTVVLRPSQKSHI